MMTLVSVRAPITTYTSIALASKAIAHLYFMSQIRVPAVAAADVPQRGALETSMTAKIVLMDPFTQKLDTMR
jgi:hypothetical protein